MTPSRYGQANILNARVRLDETVKATMAVIIISLGSHFAAPQNIVRHDQTRPV